MPVLGQSCETVTPGGEWLAAQCQGCTFMPSQHTVHLTVASHSSSLAELPWGAWECVEAPGGVKAKHKGSTSPTKFSLKI